MLFHCPASKRVTTCVRLHMRLASVVLGWGRQYLPLNFNKLKGRYIQIYNLAFNDILSCGHVSWSTKESLTFKICELFMCTCLRIRLFQIALAKAEQ